jgi:hypothetical protein
MHGKIWTTSTLLAAIALGAAGAAWGQSRGPVRNVPLDAARTVDGVDVACTGIGQSKADPRWNAYSVRVEFANPAREYLANVVVEVSDASGQSLAAVRCEGPWVLLRLPPRAYRLKAWLVGQRAEPRETSFRAPAKGQTRLILTFPDGH